MLTIEKVIILKSVSIFSKVPEEMLLEVAAVAVEKEVAEGTLIFAEGESGNSLYAIVHGKVRIHHGENEVDVLVERQVFGELAVLDPEPRSASATAIEDTLLFEIDRDALYELLAEYVEVAQGIIQVLCQRLRRSGKR